MTNGQEDVLANANLSDAGPPAGARTAMRGMEVIL